MTYACQSLIACPQIQEDINGVFGRDPQKVTEQNRFLKVILSAQNTNGTFQKEIDRGDGHRMQVEFRYQPRELITTVSDSAVLNCNGGPEPCNLSQIYEIDDTLGSSKSWTIALKSLEEQCEKDDSFIARQVLRMMDVITRKMDRDTVQQAFNNVGFFRDGGALPRPVETQKGVACCNGKVTDLIEQVDYEYGEVEYEGTVFGFGGDFEWKSYFKSMDLACCNDVGEDLAAMMGESSIVPFYDRNVRAFATEDLGFITFWPGALQLLTFNEFRGSIWREINDDSRKVGTLMHPDPAYNGLLFDYNVELRCVHGNSYRWLFQLKLAHALEAAPADMFFSQDPLTQTNGVFEFFINNPA